MATPDTVLPPRLIWARRWFFVISFSFQWVVGGGSVNYAAEVATAAEIASLPLAEVRERIAALRAEVAHHDELYFKRAAPVISDAAYDQLKRELAEWEGRYPALSTAPSDGLGVDDRTGLRPVYRHRERMLSLDKSYSELELRSFDERIRRQLGRQNLTYVVEPKYDGLALSVTYKNGRLVRAVTRGDGEVGDDVTANVLASTTLPKMLRGAGPTGSAPGIPAVLEVRGEIYLEFAEFARINQARLRAGEPSFSHPRNLAAGTLQQSDLSTAAARKLTVVFYGYGGCEPLSLRPVAQQNWLQQLRAWGLPTVENARVVQGADALWLAVQAMGRERKNYPFPTDGVVVKLDEGLLQKQMGATHQAPRWALAYKFSPERAQTKLLAITLQVGRTGVLTPVGELQPVPLSGATVTRASLYNRDEIARRDIRVGDYVYVEKAGEIIPAISGVNRSRRTAGVLAYVFPVSCPSCQSRLQQSPEQAAVRCLNRHCPAQVRRRLEHFSSSAGVNIAGLGPVLIDQLVSTGRVKTTADLYRLRREDFPAGNGKTAERVLRAIAQSKQAELWRFIHGLGIPGVGEVGARALARQSGGLVELARAFHDAETAAAWGKKVDLGEASLQAVQEYFSEPSHQALLVDLVALGVRPNNSPEVGGADQLLQGKRFVLTGALQRLTRAQATALIMAAGGAVEAKVSRRTDYLIVGEGGSAKLPEAAAFGVTMIDEAKLQQLLRPGAAWQ